MATKAAAKKVPVKKPMGAGLDVSGVMANGEGTPIVPSEVWNPPTDGSFTPITVIETVDKLPASVASAVPPEVVKAIIATKGDKWAKVGLGGRKVSTVRNNINRALEGEGYSIKTRAIGDALYVTLK